MNEVVVHIGTCKTGTTSIQTFLERNAELLRGQDYGVVTPWFGIEPIRRTLMELPCGLMATGHPFVGEEVLRKKYKPYAELDFIATLEEAKKALAIVSCKQSVVLSSEAFSDPCLARFRKKMCLLKRLLKPVQATHRLRIVVYFRRQDRYLESLYGTWQKPCYITAFSDFMANVQLGGTDGSTSCYDLDWSHHLAVIQEFFSSEEIEVFSYDIVADTCSIVEHFAQTLGLQCAGSVTQGWREAVSIPPFLMQVIHHAGETDPEECERLTRILSRDYDIVPLALANCGLMDPIRRKTMLANYRSRNYSLFGKKNDDRFCRLFDPEEPERPLPQLDEMLRFLLTNITHREAVLEQIYLKRRARYAISVPRFLRKAVPRAIRARILDLLTGERVT